MDREPDRIEELKAERDEARQAFRIAMKEREEAAGRVTELEARNEKLEMQVHQYNRRVGWPRYPLKGE